MNQSPRRRGGLVIIALDHRVRGLGRARRTVGVLVPALNVVPAAIGGLGVYHPRDGGCRGWDGLSGPRTSDGGCGDGGRGDGVRRPVI